jgi:hypothetical protein
MEADVLKPSFSSPSSQLIGCASRKKQFRRFGSEANILVKLNAAIAVSEAFAFMNSIVPSGVTIPLHSHQDPEVFFVIDGTLEVLQ